ncbi:MAG: hypothetical protein KKG53_08375 [Proteobacteria bacterium]|nr:hypothetical protein [Pseudomonadota bacterium]
MKKRFIRSVVWALVVTAIWAGLIVYSHLSGEMAPEVVRENYLSSLYVFPSATAIIFVFGLYRALRSSAFKAGGKAADKLFVQEEDKKEGDN